MANIADGKGEGSMSSDSQYTSHTAAAAFSGGAIAVLAVWIASLFMVNMPADVAIAFATIVTPIASAIFKRFNLLSA